MVEMYINMIENPIRNLSKKLKLNDHLCCHLIEARGHRDCDRMIVLSVIFPSISPSYITSTNGLTDTENERPV